MAKKYDGRDVSVGIDLGTTYSCIAVWQDEQNKIELRLFTMIKATEQLLLLLLLPTMKG